MTARGWLAACSVAAALIGCGGDPAASPTVSTGGPPDATDDERDAGTAAADSGAPEPEQDASVIPDAGRQPAPIAPTTDGVHLSIERGPYRTASDAFYFETARPGIQGEFDDGTLRVELSETLGATSCSDGATVEWLVAGGSLVANRELGACSITIEAFGASSGASIAATFRATVERGTGEVADALELLGRIQVGHP